MGEGGRAAGGGQGRLRVGELERVEWMLMEVLKEIGQQRGKLERRRRKLDPCSKISEGAFLRRRKKPTFSPSSFFPLVLHPSCYPTLPAFRRFLARQSV